MGLSEGLVEFSVEERFRQFGFLDHLLHLLEQALELFLLLVELFGDFLFVVRRLVSQGTSRFLGFVLFGKLLSDLLLTLGELSGLPAHVAHLLGELV